MAFGNASKNLALERSLRQKLKGRLLQFGNSFLDDSLLGIRPDDLILVGAPSGIGKTQFCVSVALFNAAAGKKVHFFALEAGEFEIERRIKFQFIAKEFYLNPTRPSLGRPLQFDEWEVGAYGEALALYEEKAEKNAQEALKNLHTFYKSEKFDYAKLIEYVGLIQDETDLIIVDHVHYFDWDDDNDNRAIKEIAKAARDVCLKSEKPIILVAHLRKRDKQNAEIAAGLDEFHGSSDLTKIATKVITLAAGGPAENGGYYTYLRTPKNRHSGSSSRFLAQMIFNEKTGAYENEYKLGWANSTKFGELECAKFPSWMGRSSQERQRLGTHVGNSNTDIQGAPGVVGYPGRVRNYAPGADND